MKYLACLLLVIVVACGASKHTLDFPSKCNLNPTTAWRYDHTEYWTTYEPIYGYESRWNYQTNQYETEYVQTGTRTVEHSRDVWSCQLRR